MVFAIALGIKVPLVDSNYGYTFEADSEGCVEETRPFYFFFENPCKETTPHPLSPYPTYFDGDYIASAALANLVRPLCKAGIIKAPLSDSDNSIIIFSMRWTGVLFDALAAMLAYLTVLLLTRNSFTALSLTLLYYILNAATLHIDLIRVDHYTLFAANLVMFSTILLMQFPGKKTLYLLAGFATGLACATKLNFPFHLAPLALAFLVLLVQRKISVGSFFVLVLSFLFMVFVMFQRWMLYPENIHDTIKEIIQVGEEWFGFWGNGNRAYYLLDAFMPQGFSPLVVLGLAGFYGSVLYYLYSAITKRDALKGVLFVAFFLQTIALIVSPKIARYGVVMPLWVVIFMGTAINDILIRIGNGNRKIIAQVAVAILLLPMFVYEWMDYSIVKNTANEFAQSVTETRTKALEWVRANVKPGSIMAYQAPKVSNAPVFELPLVFDEHYLTFPFLDKASFEKFLPPNIDELKAKVNYVMIADKEKDYQFFLFDSYKVDAELVKQWKQFYDALTAYPHHDFSSSYKGLAATHIYQLDTLPKGTMPAVVASNALSDDTLKLTMAATSIPIYDIANFQIQISDDSTMRWLVSGSRDGYPSAYRPMDGEIKGNSIIQSMVPAQIMGAMMAGNFPNMLGHNPSRKKEEIELFFRKVLLDMVLDSLTFKQSFNSMANGSLDAELRIMDSKYHGDGSLLNSYTADYIKMTGLPEDAAELCKAAIGKATYTFIPNTKFKKGTTYYWRARLRFKDNVHSGWSNTSSFTIANGSK